MSCLDDELRNAMRREEPPEGFVERVLAKVPATNQDKWTSLFAWRGLKWALAGAMCLGLAAAVVEHQRAQEEQARGMAAKAQLMLALRITSYKLQFAQAKVQRIADPWPSRSQSREN
jgi:hypothetical protein